MSELYSFLEKFCSQAHTEKLSYAGEYPSFWEGFEISISFGRGQPARIPWIAFLSSEMRVTRGIYPVYLYYKKDNILVLSYGVSETEEPDKDWPLSIRENSETIEDYLDIDVPRYGNSYVAKAYKVDLSSSEGIFYDLRDDSEIDEASITQDLSSVLKEYESIVEGVAPEPGLFYMEKQLEDFLIENWENTGLGRKYDLIVEDGVVLSQQYKTDIGRIDLLIKEKDTGKYVVVELKKGQTSDQTVGQIARYIGWIKEHRSPGKEVGGIIIAGKYDKKLNYAVKALSGLELEIYLYRVDFRLDPFDS